MEQSRSPGTILDMTLIQGEKENTCDGIQLKKNNNIANEFRVMENRCWSYWLEMFFLT